MKLNIPLITAGVAVIINNSCGTEEKKPNVIFILADDLGWSQTGAYGSEYYYTPSIDRLAAEGIRFTNAYSSATVSSPTRAAVMTGKYPARLHLTDFIPGGNRVNDPLLIPEWRKFLPLEELTIAELFRDKGYTTASFGKWHLGPEKFGPESLPFNPDKQGFDEHFVIDKPDKTTDPEHDPHSSDSIGNRSVEFLHEYAGKPFFLYMSFSAIHNPLKEKVDSIAMWENVHGSDKPENNPIIAAMLSRMDRNIGKVLDALDELDLTQNTIVVFYSDNGGLEKDAKQTPLRKGKGWLYEGGIRVPLIIRWPGVVTIGKISDEVITSVDFMPTFCDLINAETPSNVDGISILPYLRTGNPLPERNHYWHYPHYHTTGMVPGGAVRSGKWKLIEWYEKSIMNSSEPAYELFDLENDLGEEINLADTMKDITQKLASDLKNWREEINAQMPEPNPDYTFTK